MPAVSIKKKENVFSGHEQSLRFRDTLLCENIQRLKIIGGAGIAVNAFLIALFWNDESAPALASADARTRLVWIAATVLYIVLTGSPRPSDRPAFWQRLGFYIAVALCPVFSALLTTSALASSSATFVYIVNIMLIGAFLFMPVLEFVLVMVPGFVVLLYGLGIPFGFDSTSVPAVINISGTMVFSWLIGALNLRLKRDQFVSMDRLESALMELRSLADLDGLTGLPNRRKLADALGFWRSVLDRQPADFSMALFDIDFFKSYNDTYGHLAGDDCLKRIASLLLSEVPRKTDILARFGGEKFLMVFPDAGEGLAQTVAGRVRKRLNEMKILHDTSLTGFVSVSVGIAVCRNAAASDLDLLLDSAERALYQAKQAGRDRIVIEDINL